MLIKHVFNSYFFNHISKIDSIKKFDYDHLYTETHISSSTDRAFTIDDSRPLKSSPTSQKAVGVLKIRSVSNQREMINYFYKYLWFTN